MPIIDPSLQFVITSGYYPESDNNREDYILNRNYDSFYLYFLRIASRNIYQNLHTIEAYMQFKKDLYELFSFINKKFFCQISKSDLNNPKITNYYKFLYDHIKTKSKEKISIQEKGCYLIYEDQNIKFFQYSFKIKSELTHSWFFSDTPIAILSINTGSFEYIRNDSIIQSIKLEIDLMAACGYIIVLCIKDQGYKLDFLFELIERNQFSEIHYNIEINMWSDYNANTFFKEFDSKYYNCLKNFKGYFYLYCNYYDQERYISKQFKEIPRVKVVQFSECFSSVFGHGGFTLSKPFLFCQNGFNHKYLRIHLCNVPLYDSEKDDESFIPSQVSECSVGFINRDDFLHFKKIRIPILYRNENKNGKHFRKYVNFDDIHIIRPDLHVINPLYLAKVKNSALETVKTMESNIISKFIGTRDKKFVEDYFISLSINKIRKSLEYAAYAYSYAKYKEGIKFFANRAQIYTAYQACQRFISKSNDKNEKGMVFQVETGEGKTCIVCLIAAALAKLKKTVHITSSNIKLSIRDYEESFKFFSMLKIKTAILAHKDELPKFVQEKMKKEEHDDNNEAKNDKDINIADENKEIENTNMNEEDKEEEEIVDKNDFINYENYDSELKDEIESFFKNNVDEYLKNNSQINEKSLEECYPSEYYNNELFKNSSRMNFSVCGLDENKKTSNNKASVVYSTFVNFECLYLKMLELYPGSVEPYFTDCGLLIDEADSILIDEIANGTIISRSVKSNSTEILKFVYDQKKLGKKENETFTLIQNYMKWSLCKTLNKEQVKQMYKEIGTKHKPDKKKWLLCSELTEEHIKQMYEEIDIVHKPEYTKGKKYSIEKIVVEDKKSKNKYIKEALNLAGDISKDIISNFVKEFTKDPNNEDDEEDDDDEDDEDEDEEDDEEENDEKPLFFNHIVPFGYDRNGILEPNKEFGGFIQQFIAIKESVDNNVENMIVNDISMSFLYVSHPIFVNLYGAVCGLTGTVGNKSDEKIYKDEYGLVTMKIPRYNPNLNVEFPKIICKDEDERNAKIVSEVVEFHERGNPVLVIFQSLDEIETIESMLTSKGIKIINIFNGKDDLLKPDEIAGINGAVSLGTNVCGRGTDIKAKGKPLHVIVSYFSSNTRVMEQAYGRTARQGKKGTYRTICTENQFFMPKKVLEKVDKSLAEFSTKNLRQREFVDHFKAKRKWIFSNYIKKQSIPNEYIAAMRKAKINVNRIVAYNYIFPICMKRDTFLKIQEQKIFSIFNCPNSQFTWRLFQRYIREMILQSWSLLINELDQKYKDKPKDEYYDKELVEKRKVLYKTLKIYLPDSNYDIVQTFMHIFNHVLKQYENDIFKTFTKMANPLLDINKSVFFSCKLGFKPYALLSESGARIFHKNFKKTNFIKDPELKYERRTMKKHIFTIASITDKIDDIFNKIFMKVNEILGTKTFLKLFLRRTLAGCEFGFCVMLNIKSNNEKFLSENPYCIIDVDPLLVFTIFVRSLFPVLAIILISVLVYVASIAKKMASWFQFPQNIGKVVKTTISIVVDSFAENISKKILEKIIAFLEKNLNENIKQIKKIDGKSADILNNIKDIFSSKESKKVAEKLSKHFNNMIKIKTNFGKLINKCLDPASLMKISVYIMLLIASFIMNYHHHKIAIMDYRKESEDYINDESEKNLKKICKRFDGDVVLLDIEENEEEEVNEINNVSNTYLYRMVACNVKDLIVNLTDFKFSKKSFIKDGVLAIAHCIQKSNKSKNLIVSYKGNRKAFMQQVLIYATNQFPSILKLVGYNIKNTNNQFLLLEKKENGNLESVIDSKQIKINETNKLIISYGIARALEFLHKHKIVHRNLNASNIYIDSKFYPFVSDFYMAKQTELNLNYNLKYTKSEYMAPEFISDYISNQSSFKIDVYSYGIILYYLITGIKPYHNYSSADELMKDVVNNKRPEFPSSVPNEWKKLIIMCLDANPSLRPDFTEICHILESHEFTKRINYNEFNIYKDDFIDKQELQAREE